MNDQQQSRADALTDDQRQMLGEALTEYFTELDRDIGIDTPDRILSLIDYHDDRFIDDLIDRAIVPALSISANETGAEGAAITDHDAKGLEIIAGWLYKDGLVEPAAMLRRLASARSPLWRQQRWPKSTALLNAKRIAGPIVPSAAALAFGPGRPTSGRRHGIVKIPYRNAELSATVAPNKPARQPR